MVISAASDHKLMHLNSITALKPRRVCSAFTLAEVVIAIAIVAVVYGGMFVGYTQATRRAQWTGYSLAAQALAVQQIEQARSAVWDPSMPQNQITNLSLISSNLSGAANSYTYTGYSWTNLDIPSYGANFVRATNFVKITMLTYSNSGASALSGVYLQMIRVDTVWPFIWGSGSGTKTLLYTNTICTYEAPDNRDNSTL